MDPNPEVKEFDAIRAEYAYLNQIITSTVTYSLGGYLAIYAVLIKLVMDPSPTGKPLNISFFAYFLPIFIVFPACGFIAISLANLFKQGAYIQVFLETKLNMHYEKRLNKLNSGSFAAMSYGLVVLLVYFFLLVFNIAWFYYLGNKCTYHLAVYGATLCAFIPLCYFLLKDWSAFYVKKWKAVQTEEALPN